MKRKLFIGSSTEGFRIAQQVKDLISSACGDWIEIELWKEGSVFKNNSSFLDSLVKASRRYDYGIMVATADDIIKYRNLITKVPRDNVVFELGLFLGSLGLKRAFLFADKKSKLPSDYNGITIPKFKNGNVSKTEIQLIINELENTRSSFALKPVPSAALALGYFDSFILPIAKSPIGQDMELKILLPTCLEDIESVKREFLIKNPSQEISANGNNSRPMVYRLNANENSYWDIPTTLNTLNKLIKMVVHSSEIGINPEHKEWIEYELRNFEGAIQVLCSENSFTKSKNITVSFLE
jgi:hypothetical protein